jgi:quercetin dioxygenase-like cupin family protein
MSGDARVVDGAGRAAFQSPAAEDVLVRATGEGTDGRYDLVEVTIPPGPAVTPLHVRHENDEAMHGLEGEVAVVLGEERHVLAAGAYAVAPRGLPHTYRNASDEPARVPFVYTPGSHSEYLRETGEPGSVEDESDVEALLPILEGSGIGMVGPPVDGPRAGER